MEFQVLNKHERVCKITGIGLLLSLVVVGINPVLGQEVSVAAVIDGERLVLSDGTRIKLAGVDAPEFHPSAQMSQEALITGKTEEAVKRQGAIAFAYLRMLTTGRALQVQYEPAAPFYDEANMYKLAYLHVVDQNGRIIYTLNGRMIEDGYASVDSEVEATMMSTYRILEAAARKKGKGLWANPSLYTFSSRGKSHPSEGAMLQSACAINKACVWVGDGNAGMWQSRIGRQCPCADQ